MFDVQYIARAARLVAALGIWSHRSGAPPAGIEPATLGLEVPCSIRLSYGGVRASYDLEWNSRLKQPSIEVSVNENPLSNSALGMTF